MPKIQEFDNRTAAGRAAIDRVVLKALAPKRGRSRSEVAELAGISDTAVVSASLRRHVKAGTARGEGETGQRLYLKVAQEKPAKAAA